MQNETKNCQNCKKDFVIETEDFNFYEKIKVPAPTWCPECRMIRRLSFSNIWNLNWHNCDKCGERTLSMFTPGQKMPVYCQPCWWSDSWDGTEYAMDYPWSSYLICISIKPTHLQRDAVIGWFDNAANFKTAHDNYSGDEELEKWLGL